MFSLMEFAITPLVALQSGMASAHLVKYFVTTRIHLYPGEGGLIGPTKLSPQVWKGMEGPCFASFVGEYGSNWLALGNRGTYLQILLHPSSLWANSSPFIVCIGTASSFPSAPRILLRALLLTFH